jgi:hypothetical protein
MKCTTQSGVNRGYCFLRPAFSTAALAADQENILRVVQLHSRHEPSSSPSYAKMAIFELLMILPDSNQPGEWRMRRKRTPCPL